MVVGSVDPPSPVRGVLRPGPREALRIVPRILDTADHATEEIVIDTKKVVATAVRAHGQPNDCNPNSRRNPLETAERVPTAGITTWDSSLTEEGVRPPGPEPQASSWASPMSRPSQPRM